MKITHRLSMESAASRRGQIAPEPKPQRKVTPMSWTRRTSIYETQGGAVLTARQIRRAGSKAVRNGLFPDPR